ncbi:MAG: hypothetical protein NVS3B10_27560 [Polyangiales bacterium]
MDNARSSSPSSPGAGKPAPAAVEEAPRARRVAGSTTLGTGAAPTAPSAPTTEAARAPTPTPAPSSAAPDGETTQAMRDVPIDWEALEDAFENNAPEVHSYLQLATGEVIRVVDGVADPQMHARIAADPGYLRVDPVSSREQYRWMERFIPTVEAVDLRGKLTQAIDGKGAFRRFKDVLMSHAEEREAWFAYRSERLKTFMDAWLAAHSLRAVPRPAWNPANEPAPDVSPESHGLSSRDRRKNPDALRRHVREVSEMLGPRDLEMLGAFADFLRARRIMRTPRGEADPEDLPPSSAHPAEHDSPGEEKP